MAAVAAAGLAVAAHGTAEGHAPAATPVLVGAAVLYLLGASFARRERGLVALGAFVGAGQAGLHLAFAAAPDQHVHGAGSSGPLVGGLAMLGLHAVAALVLAWWLRRGEDLAWTLLVRLARPRPVFTRWPAVAVRPSGVVFPTPRVLVTRALLLPVGRRGPPVTWS